MPRRHDLSRFGCGVFPDPMQDRCTSTTCFRPRRRSRAFCAGALAIASALSLGGPVLGRDALTIRVTPVIGSEPADLNIQATVEANDDNRSLEIQLDSDALYRSSTIELHGLRTPHVSLFNFRGLPAGTYKVLASLGGTTGVRARATRVIVVLPTGR
jgi:hypothetical protein